jgi:hypothetical protein
LNIPIILKANHNEAASQPMTEPWKKGTVIGITKGERAQSYALVMTENGEFEAYANWYAIEAEPPKEESSLLTDTHFPDLDKQLSELSITP